MGAPEPPGRSPPRASRPVPSQSSEGPLPSKQPQKWAYFVLPRDRRGRVQGAVSGDSGGGRGRTAVCTQGCWDHAPLVVAMTGPWATTPSSHALSRPRPSPSNVSLCLTPLSVVRGYSQMLRESERKEGREGRREKEREDARLGSRGVPSRLGLSGLRRRPPGRSERRVVFKQHRTLLEQTGRTRHLNSKRQPEGASRCWCLYVGTVGTEWTSEEATPTIGGVLMVRGPCWGLQGEVAGTAQASPLRCGLRCLPRL